MAMGATFTCVDWPQRKMWGDGNTVVPFPWPGRWVWALSSPQWAEHGRVPGEATPARQRVLCCPRLAASPRPRNVLPWEPARPRPTETARTTASCAPVPSLLISIFIHVSLPLLPW